MGCAILTTTLIIVLSVNFGLSSGQKCDDGTLVDGICYTVLLINSTWNAAESHCERYQAKLASVNSEAVQNAIADQAKSKSAVFTVKTLWIGAQEKVGDTFSDRLWKWDSDGSVVGPQGCYNNGINQGGSTLINPFTCMQNCKNGGYTYADISGGGYCYCFNGTFTSYVSSSRCNMNCATCTQPCRSPIKRCGGSGVSNIYDLKGSYALWGIHQPNNDGNYQMCGVLDHRFNPYKFSDETCSHLNPYICNINNQPSCVGKTATGAYFRGSNTSNCYFISNNDNSSNLNWYMARQKCREYGGNLVKISGTLLPTLQSNVHDELIVLLNQAWEGRRDGVKLWTGLRRGEWKWVTGEPFKYTNWFTNEPSASNQECAMMSRDNRWMWSDELCTKYSYFVCQGGNLPTTTTTTTTTTTVSTVTQNPTASTTTNNGATPTAGAQTSGGLNNEEIVLLVVLLVLGAIAILIFVLLCIYCCKKDQRKVDTTTKQAPSETSRTSTTSDYSHKFIDINDKTDFFSGHEQQQRY